MTDAPNQMQIKPSVKAVEATLRLEWPSWEKMHESMRNSLRASRRYELVAAYAIDLASIIEERDRMKAALEIIQDRACDSNIDHYMVNFIYDACHAALEPKS